MEIAYWIVAALLAALYLFSGAKKAFQSKDQLRPMMAWVDPAQHGVALTAADATAPGRTACRRRAARVRAA